jgi:hypothetical protein
MLAVGAAAVAGTLRRRSAKATEEGESGEPADQVSDEDDEAKR